MSSLTSIVGGYHLCPYESRFYVPCRRHEPVQPQNPIVAAIAISNTLDADFCVEVLQEALRRYGRPEVFNTDQGCQFTSKEFTGTFKEHDVKIRIDDHGRCQGNIFIERLWWTIKYQYLYLRSFENGRALRGGLSKWINGYNHDKDHSSLDDKPPDEIYYGLPHPFEQPA